MATGYGKKEFGVGSDAFWLFVSSVDMTEVPFTNVILRDEFLINKKSEINLLRKIFFTIFQLINNDYSNDTTNFDEVYQKSDKLDLCVL